MGLPLRNLLLFIAGLVASQGFARLYIWPALLGGLIFLVWCIKRAQSAKQAFWHGYSFGMGMFILSMAWITNALFIDINKFWPLVVPSLLGFPLVLSVFTGFSTSVAYGAYTKGCFLPLAFPIAWVLGELMRSYLFTGLPWNLVGYGFMFSDTLSQVASLTSVFGLSFIFTFVAAAFCSWKKNKVFPVMAILLLGGQFYYGYQRLAQANTVATDIHIRIVQGNINQKDKWDPTLYIKNIDHYITLSSQKTDTPPQILIWPEMAIPHDLDKNDGLCEHLASIIPSNGYLLTGAPHFDSDIITQKRNVFNTLTIVSDQGKISSVYKKSHLVPFGEYVPFRSFLQKWFAINKITPGSTDFTSGEGLETLTAPPFPPFSPLVCYEAIFPGQVVKSQGPRPQWMVNITNDGWYGDTDGPRQHLDMVRMRAIEEGMPMVRVASTGISVVTDAYGRIQGRIELNTSGILDINLPQAIPNGTFFSRVMKYLP